MLASLDGDAGGFPWLNVLGPFLLPFPQLVGVVISFKPAVRRGVNEANVRFVVAFQLEEDLTSFEIARIECPVGGGHVSCSGSKSKHGVGSLDDCSHFAK